MRPVAICAASSLIGVAGGSCAGGGATSRRDSGSGSGLPETPMATKVAAAPSTAAAVTNSKVRRAITPAFYS